MKHLKIGTPLRIKWLDTTSVDGWQYISAGSVIDGSPRLMVTRGVLVSETPVSLVMTSTVTPRGPSDTTEGHLGHLIIPRGCITEIREIP